MIRTRLILPTHYMLAAITDSNIQDLITGKVSYLYRSAPRLAGHCLTRLLT